MYDNYCDAAGNYAAGLDLVIQNCTCRYEQVES